MKHTKRFFAVLIAAVMMIGLMPIINVDMKASAVSLFDQRVSQLRTMFPNNGYWNHAVYSDSQRGDVLLANWDNTYGDYTSGTPCATHNGQPGYGQFDCNAFDGGIQCWGFANRIFYGIFGVYASTVSQRWDTQNISKGDWIRMSNETHSAVVLSRNGDYLTIVEGNRDGNCKIVWDRQIHISSVNWFKHAPNWESVVQTGTWPYLSTSSPWTTNTNARIEARLDSLYYCTSIGFYYGTSTNNFTKCSVPFNANVQEMAFEMNGRGIQLTHGTKYFFKFFIVTGGRELQSDINAFTTTGSHNYSSSTISNPATCVSPGIKILSCSCGATKTESIPINSNNHVNTTNIATTSSTCKTHGYTAGVYCNDCKNYISGHVEQPLGDHQTTIINARAATVDAEGYSGDEYCTVCQQTISYGHATPKLDPSEQLQSVCPWCGGEHVGFFQGIIGWFHGILAAIFGARY